MSTNGPWKNEWVCIGGGTSGFGLTLAGEFALKGAKVAILGRDLERGRQAVEQLKHSHGAEVRFFNVDLTEPSSIEASEWPTWTETVHLKAAIAAAGESDRGYVSGLTSDELTRLWKINVITALLFSRTCLPSLQRSGGTLVHIASLAGIVASPGLGGYPTVKHALVGLSRQMRLEVARDGVRVLTVCPGPIQRSQEQEGRYDALVAKRNLPEELKQAAGSSLVKMLEPVQLARRTILAIERQELELVLPGKVKLLAGLGNVFPSLFARFLK